MSTHTNLFHENPYLVPSLIVLAAAVILSGALLARPEAQATADVQMPKNFVPASTSSPAHLVPEKGQTNPSASLPHYASYAPQSFKVSSVGSDSITGDYLNDPSTTVTIHISSATDIYGKGALKSNAEYQQELTTFQNNMRYADTNDVYVAPDNFTHTPLTLSSIKAGMTVTVAANGTDADSVFVQQ